MSARAAGFTLTELIVILAIVGVLAWVAFPKFSAYNEIKLDAAARRLAADLRYAQNQTIGKRKTHGILFETARNRYTVFAPTPATPAFDPADPGRPLQVDFDAAAAYRGVTLASAAFGSTPGVRFDYFGVPRDSAGVELATVGRVILSYQGLADTVEVAPLTGAVTVR
jgi:prepilin-type N-terminal cleavage/methylation domain-containing protein